MCNNVLLENSYLTQDNWAEASERKKIKKSIISQQLSNDELIDLCTDLILSNIQLADEKEKC